MARKSYRRWEPGQGYLLPPSPRDWLPEGHLAYFILDVVDELDLRPIEDALQSKDARGTRPHHPGMMVSLLLYAYCVGVFSSRRIERATHEDVAFRVITGEQQPHFTRICAFRREHRAALEGLFLKVLKLCKRAGLVKLGQVAIDGSKVQASASKHKAMSYERMVAMEARLEAEVEELLARAENVDDDEDTRFGESQREEDLPEELRRREQRLARIREAKSALEKEARAAQAEHRRTLAAGCRQRAEEASSTKTKRTNETLAKKHEGVADQLTDSDDEDPPSFTTSDGLPKHRPKSKPDGTPKPKAQRNFTDADSRLMESGGQFLQAYNCQAAVDADNQIIVAHAVTNAPADAHNLVPMVELVERNLGKAPDVLMADSGYWATGVADTCDERGAMTLIAVERRRHWDRDGPPAVGSPPDDASPREKMAWRMRTAEARTLYARRKVIVEPVFGQIKEARGFRRFLLRGLDKVTTEWSLLATTHNLLKLFRAQTAAAVA